MISNQTIDILWFSVFDLLKHLL